ncbi:hypothetical protein [Nitrospirillum sp. BR 11163]|uniref:hypothetical protein n=1 Tax=Nitrospirillum sp. BR 11163 TaxID=3104323 RepID=UPI002AFE7B50|nr:hypothetical protein [Nitrospirillum sp. BR 11163]MEA1674097.1 hypothetical protein [Nitrospirillum sp. BR 11163]
MTDPTVLERITQALCAGLATVPVGDGTAAVFRGRRNGIDAARFPAYRVNRGDFESEQASSAHVVNRQVFHVEGLVVGDDDETADRAAIALAEGVRGLIETDWTLGGLAVNSTVRAGGPDDAGTEDVPYIVGVLVEIDVEFWTKPGDPTALAP